MFRLIQQSIKTRKVQSIALALTIAVSVGACVALFLLGSGVFRGIELNKERSGEIKKKRNGYGNMVYFPYRYENILTLHRKDKSIRKYYVRWMWNIKYYEAFEVLNYYVILDKQKDYDSEILKI